MFKRWFKRFIGFLRRLLGLRLEAPRPVSLLEVSVVGKNVKLSWVDPVARVDDESLDQGDFEKVVLFKNTMSVEYSEAGRVTGTDQSFVVPNLSAGIWDFRIVVVDKQDPPVSSVGTDISGQVDDNGTAAKAAPKAVTDLTMEVLPGQTEETPGG